MSRIDFQQINKRYAPNLPLTIHNATLTIVGGTVAGVGLVTWAAAGLVTLLEADALTAVLAHPDFLFTRRPSAEAPTHQLPARAGTLFWSAAGRSGRTIWPSLIAGAKSGEVISTGSSRCARKSAACTSTAAGSGVNTAASWLSMPRPMLLSASLSR